MPTIDLTDDELAAITALLKRAIKQDKFPLAPRIDPLRSALAKSSIPPWRHAVEALYAIRLQEVWLVGETLEHALAALQPGLGRAELLAIHPVAMLRRTGC